MNRVQRKFVIDALDQEHKLTEWESQFVNDLAERDDEIRTCNCPIGRTKF